MRYRRTGRTTHETVEVYDVDRCAGCGGPLGRGRTVMGWLPCSCSTAYRGRGHRQWWCLTCETWTYDPPHDPDTPPMVGGTNYAH